MLDDDVLNRSILQTGFCFADLSDDIHAAYDFAENRMLIVEVRRRDEGDEELAAVGVRSCVRHRKNSRLRMPELWIEFIFELISGTASASAERIAALNHETINDAVKNRPVIKGLMALLAG